MGYTKTEIHERKAAKRERKREKKYEEKAQTIAVAAAEYAEAKATAAASGNFISLGEEGSEKPHGQKTYRDPITGLYREETNLEKAERRRKARHDEKKVKKAREAERKAANEALQPKCNTLKYSREGRAIMKQQKEERIAEGPSPWAPRVFPEKPPTKKKDQNVDMEDAPGKTSKNRYICFIGQLPRTANVESVTKHFAKVKPENVRVPTDKATGVGKGYAFVEFEEFDRMKTCLKLYHHSEFDDGNGKTRKINVELTAGGGGNKSEVRKLRINEKNAKLADERKRHYENERQEKENSEKKDTRQHIKEEHKFKKKRKRSQMEEESAAAEPSREDAGGIHPSRLAMLSR